MNLLEPYNFFFELPLYTKVKIDSQNIDDFLFLMTTSQPIEAYNPILKQDTTYRIAQNPSTPIGAQFRQEITAYTTGIKQFDLVCSRMSFRISVFFKVVKRNDKEHDLIKVGQNPSIADLHISKIKEYDKILSNDKLKEITKAVGLAANGVGIGSFVYLRRVFEYLIEEAHQNAKKDVGWDEHQYNKNRMAEKIDQLQHHLPVFLVENKGLYSILSKGIHELDENECLEYFEAVKVGIEFILDEKVDEFNKKKKIEDAKKRIQSIGQQIGNKK